MVAAGAIALSSLVRCHVHGLVPGWWYVVLLLRAGQQICAIIHHHHAAYVPLSLLALQHNDMDAYAARDVRKTAQKQWRQQHTGIQAHNRGGRSRVGASLLHGARIEQRPVP